MAFLGPGTKECRGFFSCSRAVRNGKRRTTFDNVKVLEAVRGRRRDARHVSAGGLQRNTGLVKGGSRADLRRANGAPGDLAVGQD